ncbi:MAG: ABC transporter ATP-binding protein [bacterium]|nr:ABC transporter ATP-binding protein [bacterium]
MTKKRIPTVEIKNLKKSFFVGKEEIPVLKGLDFTIDFGEFVVILGPSGCGKSTLLNTILGLEQPTEGQVLIRGKEVYSMDEDGRASFRRQKFGMVYQQPNWIRSLNVIENVAFPLHVSGTHHQTAMSKAKNILYLFKFDKFEKYYPMELSGGQQQKLSVCRALITNPWIIMADEPTGNLDTVTAEDLMYDLKVLNAESKRTVIMVTHNPEYERYATKLIYMEDGLIKNIKQKSKPLISSEEEERVVDLAEGEGIV